MPMSRRTFLGSAAAFSAWAAGGRVRAESPFPTALPCAHEAANYGPFRYAQFHVAACAAASTPVMRGISARSFGPAAAGVYEKAVAFHASGIAGSPLVRAVLQHNAVPGERAPDHFLLTLEYDNGASAVFICGPDGTTFQPGILRFEDASCELHASHRRITKDFGATWEDARPCRRAHLDAAMDPALLIHQAFVKVLA